MGQGCLPLRCEDLRQLREKTRLAALFEALHSDTMEVLHYGEQMDVQRLDLVESRLKYDTPTNSIELHAYMMNTHLPRKKVFLHGPHTRHTLTNFAPHPLHPRLKPARHPSSKQPALLLPPKAAQHLTPSPHLEHTYIHTYIHTYSR